MAAYREFRVGGNNPNPFGWIGSVLMLAMVLIIGYIIVKGIFTLLFWLSPILFIAGVAIDPKGAWNTGKSFFRYAKKNPLVPIAIVILSALWFPLVPGVLVALTGTFLLIKTLVKRKIKKVFNPEGRVQEKEVFIEYEDVTEEEEEESYLELPEAHKEPEKSRRTGNEYDNLFE